MNDNIEVLISGPVEGESLYRTVVLNSSVPFAAQVADANTKYVIKHNYSLGSGAVVIPEGCILEFDGGRLSDGIITGNDTVLLYARPLDDILDDVKLEGSFIYNNIAVDDETIKSDRGGISVKEGGIGRAHLNESVADGEDIGFTAERGIHLKDKAYSPADFSGLGKVLLRKNIQQVRLRGWMFKKIDDIVYLFYSDGDKVYGVHNTGNKGLVLEGNIVVETDRYNTPDLPDAVIGKYVKYTTNDGVYTVTLRDGTTVTSTELNQTRMSYYDDCVDVDRNILTEDMLNSADTVYVIRYDYNLNGEDIHLPAGCVLLFDGGSVTNGRIYSNCTKLAGCYKDSADSLLGAYYAAEGTLLDHNKDGVQDMLLGVRFGEALADYNEQFGTGATSVLGLAVTDTHIFMFCPTNDFDVEVSYPVVFCFDRYYNLLGYCSLGNYTQCNDATVVGGDIVIADYHHHKINRVSEAELTDACVAHTPIIMDEEEVDGIAGQLDYDGETRTYCAVKGNKVIILDETFSVVRRGSLNLYTEMRNHLGSNIVTQGCAYVKGLIYFGVSVGGRRDTVIAVYDVATDSIVKYVGVPASSEDAGIEGMCKDPVTGEIMAAFNVRGNSIQHFEIAAMGVSETVYALGDNAKSGRGYADCANDVTLWVDNARADRNYVPDGTADKPYRSITEALVCRKETGRYTQLNVVATDTDYYCVCLATAPVSGLRIIGQGNDKPHIVMCADVSANTDILITDALLRGVTDTNADNCIIRVSGQNASLRFERVDFVMTNSAPNGVATDEGVYSTIGFCQCSFAGSDAEASPVYPDFECGSACVSWRGSGNILFDGDGANAFSHCVGIDVIESHFPHISFAGASTVANMTFDGAAFVRCHNNAVYGNMFLGEAADDALYATFKDFLRYCSDGTCSVRILTDKRLDNGDVMEPGVYVGQGLDFKPIGNIVFGSHSNGDNLIKDSSNLVIRASEPDELDIFGSWRRVWRVMGEAVYPVPSIVDAGFNLIDGVHKAFLFEREQDSETVVAGYNLPLVAGHRYSVSLWAKGRARMGLYTGSFESPFYTFEVDSNTYQYYHAMITPESTGVTALYIACLSAGSVYVCAPKIELGDRPTLWRADVVSGGADTRPARPNIGDAYYDTSFTPSRVLYWDGDKWTSQLTPASTQDSSQSSPTDNLMVRTAGGDYVEIPRNEFVAAIRDVIGNVILANPKDNVSNVPCISNEGEMGAVTITTLMSALESNLTRIPANSDLDDYTTCGLYYVASSSDAQSIINKPSSLTYAFTMRIAPYMLVYRVQIAYVSLNTVLTIWVRSSAKNGWGVWRKITTEEDS